MIVDTAPEIHSKLSIQKPPRRRWVPSPSLLHLLAESHDNPQTARHKEGAPVAEDVLTVQDMSLWVTSNVESVCVCK